MERADRFASEVEDPASPLAMALVPGSRSLLMAFGGIIGALGIPPFEFFNLTRDLDLSRVYVRDLEQSWYHAGLPGVSSGVRDTAEFLARVAKDSGAVRLVLVGNSMGGYASLLFGALLGADEVHAFSPQTFIDPANRARHGDARWSAQMASLHRGSPSPYYDLVPVLRDRAGGGTLTVHYSPADALDTVHAERLASLPNVRVKRYLEGGHNVIKYLRQIGALEQIVRDATASHPTDTADGRPT